MDTASEHSNSAGCSPSRSSANEKCSQRTGSVASSELDSAFEDPKVATRTSANGSETRTSSCSSQERETLPSTQEDLSAHWKKCYNAISEFDSKIVSTWTEEMNTILIFAGLYSAVVTAFLIESYQWLSEDPVEALLTRISSQLDPSNSSSVNTPFTPSRSNVIINLAWFSSLILALTAVLMAILVKQWLVQYSWTNGRFVPPPRLAVGLRQLHFNSLNSPLIENSMSYAPLLLIIALFLFFAGLLILLWTLNSIIAGIITTLIGFTTIYFLTTTIAPSFDPSSMCRSIQAWSFYRIVSIFRFIVTRGKARFLYTWIDISLEYLEGKTEHLARALLWVHNHAVAWDFSSIQSVWKCAKTLGDVTAPEVLCDIYLDDPSESGEPILSKTYTDVWRTWIGDGEIEETYRLLLWTFPDDSWATRSAKNNANHVDAFCSLHFGIVYQFSDVHEILNGLTKLADLLSSTDTRLFSLPRDEGSFPTSVAEGIVYTIDFAMTLPWSGTPVIDESTTTQVSQFLTSLVEAACQTLRRTTTDERASFRSLAAAAINTAHFIAVQLKEPDLMSDKQLLRLFDAMEAFIVSSDLPPSESRNILEFWAPTLLRYCGKSNWEIWNNRQQMHSSMRALIAAFDDVPLNTYDSDDHSDILMLYMLYGSSDKRCLVYKHAAQLGIPIDNLYTPGGAQWWKERLTCSEISAVIHALVDTLLAPTAWSSSGGNYFDILCALLSVHTTDEKTLDQVELLLQNRVNECLSSSTFLSNRDAIHKDIYSWSQSLIQILSNPAAADLRLALVPRVLPNLIRYAKWNYSSDGNMTKGFVSSSAVALELGCYNPIAEVFDDMKELMTLMTQFLENDYDACSFEGRNALRDWKDVVDRLPQDVGSFYEIPYTLLVQSIRNH
ncbi:uncharacterized protein EV420DRAFT_1558947 [Desarmillaria tabescens]|uniref:DUF6535 domain-containing protein n=1 Tax=Armillaria tabescens TaxID=1929756 RepID=A0AA39MZZ7_ARMTA|nr:uncharacterized protein EV420DRAFT_1558947 [Desarmillaria tabescens]KAK0452120.1 hypothetical protein EV420DRAFT_1558947 [Desarmillaria tabescens]